MLPRGYQLLDTQLEKLVGMQDSYRLIVPTLLYRIFLFPLKPGHSSPQFEVSFGEAEATGQK